MKPLLAKKGLLLMALGLLIVAGMTIFYAFSGNVIDTTDLVTATAVLGGTVTEQGVRAAVPDLDQNYVSKLITEIKPSRTPLDTLLRSVPTTKIDSFITEFYTVDMRGFSTSLTAEYVVVAPNWARFAVLNVGSSEMFGVQDTIIVPEVTGAANTVDGYPLALFVTAVGAGTITAYSLNGLAIAGGADAGKPGMPGIANGVTLRRMGNACNELDMQAPVISQLPEKDNNYCQIFMTQIEEGTFQRMNRKEVDWNFADFDRMSLVDMKLAIEMSYLGGYKNKFRNPTGGANKDHYMCGGILRSGIQRLDTAANNTITTPDYTEWMKKLFTGNGGSEKRYCFGGNEFIKRLQLVDEVSKQLNANSTEMVYGITFTKIVTNFGTLMVNYNHVMDMIGYNYYGLVLDMNNIEKHENMALTSEDLDLKTAGIRRADAKIITESSCPVVRYPDSHGLLFVKH